MNSLDTVSYTTLKTFTSCARLYYLTYVNQYHNDRENPHFSFGRALGAGFARTLIHSLSEGYYDLFMAYHPYLSTPKKNLTNACRALQTLNDYWIAEGYSERYTAVQTEQSFRIQCPQQKMNYIGHSDLILLDNLTGEYAIGEIKSTQLNMKDLSPLYQNTTQATLYGATLLAHHASREARVASFDRLYIVAQITNSGKIVPHIYKFPTTSVEVTEAFLFVTSNLDHFFRAKYINDWAMNGESCFSFNKPCPLLGQCNSDTIRSIPANPSPTHHPDDKPFDIETSLSQVIDYWQSSDWERSKQ